MEGGEEGPPPDGSAPAASPFTHVPKYSALLLFAMFGACIAFSETGGVPPAAPPPSKCTYSVNITKPRLLSGGVSVETVVEQDRDGCPSPTLRFTIAIDNPNGKAVGLNKYMRKGPPCFIRTTGSAILAVMTSHGREAGGRTIRNATLDLLPTNGSYSLWVYCVQGTLTERYPIPPDDGHVSYWAEYMLKDGLPIGVEVQGGSLLPCTPCRDGVVADSRKWVAFSVLEHCGAVRSEWEGIWGATGLHTYRPLRCQPRPVPSLPRGTTVELFGDSVMRGLYCQLHMWAAKLTQLPPFASNGFVSSWDGVVCGFGDKPPTWHNEFMSFRTGLNLADTMRFELGGVRVVYHPVLGNCNWTTDYAVGAAAVTKGIASAGNVSEGKRVVVVEAPGLWDFGREEGLLRNGLLEVLALPYRPMLLVTGYNALAVSRKPLPLFHAEWFEEHIACVSSRATTPLLSLLPLAFPRPDQSIDGVHFFPRPIPPMQLKTYCNPKTHAGKVEGCFWPPDAFPLSASQAAANLILSWIASVA